MDKMSSGWDDPTTSYIFHLDHPKMKNRTHGLVQRHQLSGLSYMHAPHVLQHYLVCMETPRNEVVGMIDMTRMIRETFNATDLQKHIFDDGGGSSLGMLQHILVPGELHIRQNVMELIVRVGSMMANKGIEDIRFSTLEIYGPGLVQLFTVYEDFLDLNTMEYRGKPVGSRVGFHAMVLIGIRKGHGGGRHFLLQNWWSAKQFISVDEDYFFACQPMIFFCKTPQPEIPLEWPSQNHIYAENENLDKPEQYLMVEYGSMEEVSQSIETLDFHSLFLQHSSS